MDRTIHEFRWHCGPHPCKHSDEEKAESPLAWRYSVVGRDFAYSLMLCKSGAELALHRSFLTPEEEVLVRYGTVERKELLQACDLLGADCTLESTTPANKMAFGPPSDAGLRFWSMNAVQGQKEQPPKFWRALERKATRAADQARKEKCTTGVCPRCRGEGIVKIGPKKAKRP